MEAELTSLNMVLLNPRDRWKTLTFVKIRLTKALLGFGALLHWSEVPFLQPRTGLRSETFFSLEPVLVSVTRAISWLDLSPRHPRAFAFP